jgi:hypothetical protein
MTSVEETNAGTVRRLYEQYLNENRIELLPLLVTNDVVFHSATEERGIAAYAALTERLRRVPRDAVHAAGSYCER